MMNALHSRPPIARLRLLAFLLRSNRPFTAGEVANGLECSRKTVSRDIQFLGQLGYDIEFDCAQNCYRLIQAPAPAL